MEGLTAQLSKKSEYVPAGNSSSRHALNQLGLMEPCLSGIICDLRRRRHVRANPGSTHR